MMLSFALSAAIASSAAAVPPPVEGDDRTAILAAVNALFDRLGATGAELSEFVAPEGVIFIHNEMEPENPKLIIRPNTILTDKTEASGATLQERMGIPTVLQHGDMAHVWAPYAFWMNGEKTHCGIDSLSLSRTEGAWRVTNMTYTVEPLESCADLGAPENPE